MTNPIEGIATKGRQFDQPIDGMVFQMAIRSVDEMTTPMTNSIGVATRIASRRYGKDGKDGKINWWDGKFINQRWDDKFDEMAREGLSIDGRDGKATVTSCWDCKTTMTDSINRRVGEARTVTRSIDKSAK